MQKIVEELPSLRLQQSAPPPLARKTPIKPPFPLKFETNHVILWNSNLLLERPTIRRVTVTWSWPCYCLPPPFLHIRTHLCKTEKPEVWVETNVQARRPGTSLIRPPKKFWSMVAFLKKLPDCMSGQKRWEEGDGGWGCGVTADHEYLCPGHPDSLGHPE